MGMGRVMEAAVSMSMVLMATAEATTNWGTFILIETTMAPLHVQEWANSLTAGKSSDQIHPFYLQAPWEDTEFA